MRDLVRSDDLNLPELSGHDLGLSDWGPYTKRYIGISHIPDVQAGFRFDLSVFPGLLRRSAQIPNVLWESGYHPWESSADLSYFSHRHEVIWKDQLYCDVSFSRLDRNVTLIRAACVNRGDGPQNMVLHYAAYLNPPPKGPYSSAPIHPARVELPPGAVWMPATSYSDIHFRPDDPQAGLQPDGQRRGEVREHEFVDGVGLGDGFGAQAGDVVSYKLDIAHDVPEAVLGLRYRLDKGQSLSLQLRGLAQREVRLEGTGSPEVVLVPLGHVKAGRTELSLRSAGGAALLTDGFFIATSAQASLVRFVPVVWNYVPQMLPGPRDSTLILKYDHVDCYYGLAWGHAGQVREFHGHDLDCLLRLYAHNHVSHTFRGEGEGHYLNVFLQPIFVAPHSQDRIFGLVCSGSREEVSRRLAEFDPASPQCEQQYEQARNKVVSLACNAAGDAYRPSQERMAATTLSGVVYPVRTAGTWIRHNTPGRWWDCLYTWDSGFLGLGLLQLDVQRAIDCLNAYVTPTNRKDAAFVHHGTPVPVQAYLFLELWNRTQSKELLAHFYPSMQRYHRFLAGRCDGSSTDKFKSRLLQTWDYFYNSGGWDDYPPQMHVHKNNLTGSVTPVATSAHVIRFARILKAMAGVLALPVAEYDEDIARLSEALQRYAWDESAGYFSYVVHDDSGQPVGPLRHASGRNFNMGMDGATPVLAGICTDAQRDVLLERLMSEQHMWCRYGQSTVDQSAPYYRPDGYWNGAVWMPHQWFVWKAMLDLGMADYAHRIAQTGLELWRAEVDDSYNCYEHFMVQTGKGAGWHQFSGLSSPVLVWYAAYHRPGTLSLGLDGLVLSCDWSAGQRGVKVRLKLTGKSGASVIAIVCLSDSGKYTATWDGQPIPANERYAGTLECSLPSAGEGELVIRPEA